MRIPAPCLTCGQGVLLDEIQAAPHEAVEGIERARHPVQRRHPNLSVGISEAEDTPGAGVVALLGTSGTQQCPSQQQPGCAHGEGRAGGAPSACERAEGHSRLRILAPARRAAPGNLPDGSKPRRCRGLFP